MTLRKLNWRNKKMRLSIYVVRDKDWEIILREWKLKLNTERLTNKSYQANEETKKTRLKK